VSLKSSGSEFDFNAHIQRPQISITDIVVNNFGTDADVLSNVHDDARATEDA
jgi:hypothetical protein